MRIAHNKIHWSSDELNFLSINYENYSNTELSIILNKTVKNVSRTLKRLNLFKDKKKVAVIKGRKNKDRNRDLSKINLIEIANNFETRGELHIKDPSAYSKIIKMGWADELFTHMHSNNQSIPQLMLKDLLEHILNDECSYNNRSIIPPLEIDCYFDKWKIGWEYDGKYFHTHEKDEHKKRCCLEKNVTLLNIVETTPYFRNYEVNIKNQVIEQLDIINSITKKSITIDEVLNYPIKIIKPRRLTKTERLSVYNKYISEIKKENLILYKKITYYKLYNDASLNIKNDLRRNNRFKNFEDYLKYLKEQNYSSFTELTKFEHPHRLLKKWNIPITKLHEFYSNKTTP